MPRYLVERSFADGPALPTGQKDRPALLAVIENNSLDGVTWLHSYVVADRRKTYCICDAPAPEAVRRAAQRNHWPVDRISEVRVLDPYCSD
ncbi:MAG: DUF4242 domain-containing protein [Anaerolineales bacterium]